MHKKILVTLSLLLSLGEAVELKKHFNSGQYGIFDTLITGVNEEEAIANRDWIAIYKKGASTEWKNVIDWSFVKDLECVAPAECHDLFEARSLPKGEYEVRYFKNNSYNIETSIDMVVEAHDSFLREIRIYENNAELFIYIAGFPKHVKPGKKDWVGIYKVGTSNDWANVIKWHWVDDSLKSTRISRIWEIKLEELEAGDYEVRYFLNNSYTTHKKKSFKVDNAK